MKWYWLDCPQCGGTGELYSAIYAPPEECNCWERFQVVYDPEEKDV